MSSDATSAKMYDAALLRRLGSYVRPYQRWTTLAVILLTLHAVLGVTGPYLTKIAVDYCLRPQAGPATGPAALLPADRGLALLWITGIYAFVLLLSYFVRSGQIQAMHYAGQRAMSDLRRDLFDRLQSLGLSFFDRNRSGRLVTRATTDIDALNELFTAGLVSGLGDLLTLVFMFAAMLWLSPWLTLAVLAVTPLVVLVALAFRKRSRNSHRQVRQSVGRLQGFLQERLSGVSIIQLFTHEAESLGEFDGLNEEQRNASVDATRAHAWFLPTVELMGVVVLAVLLLAGAALIERQALTLGVLIAFIQYGSRAFRPVHNLSDKFNILQAAMAASERIFDLLDTPADEPAETLGKPAPAKKESAPRVEFHNVWFAYRGEEWVLRDVSFAAEPGEVLAVVGHTGAGKTTLINLLLGFYRPQKGRIVVGGREIGEWPRAELRRQFGVVLQDPALFSGTIESNIRLGGDFVSREKALEAARGVQLDRHVARLSEGFDSPVGEGGAALSTGEKQLVAFARALAHNSRFLILDEATSAIDPETEREIRRAMQRLMKGHTSIVIAHRLSTIRSANRILVMHKGRIRETGAHEELLAQGGLYSKLYQLQFEGQE